MAVQTNDTTVNTYEDEVAFYLENSKVKSNGVREVPMAAFEKRLEAHGVTKADYKKVSDALNHESSAAAMVAFHDLEEKIGAASKEDLADENFRKDLTSTVRLPTLGGSTEVEVRAEKHSNIPFRGEGAEGPSVKIDHGRIRTTIQTKSRIHKDVFEQGAARIRAALGVEA